MAAGQGWRRSENWPLLLSLRHSRLVACSATSQEECAELERSCGNISVILMKMASPFSSITVFFLYSLWQQVEQTRSREAISYRNGSNVVSGVENDGVAMGVVERENYEGQPFPPWLCTLGNDLQPF